MEIQIIDAHTHIGMENFLARPIPEEKLKRPALQDSMDAPYERLARQMEKNHISRAVVFPFPIDEIDFEIANNYVLEAHSKFPEKFIPFLLITNDVEKWVEKGAKGIKQQDILLSPDQFDLDRIYAVLEKTGIPLIRHFRSGRGFDVAVQVKGILEKFPNLKLIIAHMGRGIPNTSQFVLENLKSLEKYNNIYFETSTVRDPLVIKEAVQIIGEDRVIYGSDFPFNTSKEENPTKIELDTIFQSGLSMEIQKKILGENISKLLDLPLLD